VAELISGMFTASRYKRSQGRIARQATFAAILGIFAATAWQTSGALSAFGKWLASFIVSADKMNNVLVTLATSYAVPLAVVGLGAWIAFRIVNIPSFADFLISVEAEMNKVSWPSRGELYRASLVVIVVIFLLTAILFTYDLVLKFIVGFLLGAGGQPPVE
jgi:preprotein translocase subunit SecE